MKINDKLNGKNFLTDLFHTLDKNLQNEREFSAVQEIVREMYKYDSKRAIKWTIHLLNKYGSKGLSNYNNHANVNNFLEEIIIMLCDKISYKRIIPLVHNKIVNTYNKVYIWKFLFQNENFNSYFLDYIEQTIIKNNDEGYKELKTNISYIMDHQHLIDKEAIDFTNFLCDILDTFINGKYIKNQKQLDFFYSLLDYIPYQPDNALLKSYFINYI